MHGGQHNMHGAGDRRKRRAAGLSGRRREATGSSSVLAIRASAMGNFRTSPRTPFSCELPAPSFVGSPFSLAHPNADLLRVASGGI